VGWTVVIFTTLLGGLWLGMSFAVGKLAPPREVFTVLVLLPLSWLLVPRVLIAVGVTLVAWYLSLRGESVRLRIVAACVNLLAWLALTAWVFSS
jgi:hypothetical protein